MTLPVLVDQNGRSVLLGPELGSGGEGAIFPLRDDPARVAKVYHRPPTVETVEKLKAMIGLANPKLLDVATWPNGLLFDPRSRKPVAFLMPRLTDFQEIWRLYHPVERLKFFPRAGWKFQLRAAYNLAAAFDEVHKSGCVVGDVQLRNAHVSPKAIVRLVDCDSFQVRANGKQFLCEVGLAHYIPPELQGKPLRGLIRTENHDRFGLAVLIYQLLFVGNHPYMGLYHGSGDPSFEELIAEYRFAQGPLARSWGMEPRPHTPTFADIPQDLGMLFRRAFERGSEKGTRPRPADWLIALKLLEQNIAECPADPGHTYWQGARSCVWCRLAEKGGPEYYYGVAGEVGTFAVDEVKLQEMLRRLAACPPLRFPYDRRPFLPTQRPEPEALPQGLDEHRSIATILALAIGFCVLLIPLGFIRGFLCLTGFLGPIIFGIWLTIHIRQSPWHQEHRRRKRASSQSHDAVNDLEMEWQQTVRRYQHDHTQMTPSVHSLVSACRGLTSEHQVEIERFTENAEAVARVRHLRLHLLADAEIPRIGAGRKQTLASKNIFTAADIDEEVVRNIKGFGDVLTACLVDWKEDVLRQFRFDPATAVSPTEQRAITLRFRTRQQQLFAELARNLARLESLAPTCRAGLQTLVPKIKQALILCEQTEANLRLLQGR